MTVNKSLFGTLISKKNTLDNESVHQLRKGTKQLRAHLHLIRQLQGHQQETEHLRQSVKKLARMLAGQRDANVMYALLQELTAQTTDAELTALMTELQHKLKGERLPRIDIRQIHKMTRDIDRSTDKLLADRPEENEINQLLEACLENLCESGQDLLYNTIANWDDLHNWRKQVKKLTYQYKLKKNPNPRDLTIIDKLDLLGDSLGKINDFNILDNFVRRQQYLNTRAQTLQTFTQLIALLDEHKDLLLVQTQQLFAELNTLLD
jgi:CHAD domain-containing protein